MPAGCAEISGLLLMRLELLCAYFKGKLYKETLPAGLASGLHGEDVASI